MRGGKFSEILRNKHARVLTVILVLQAGLFYGASRPEKVTPIPPLQTFPVAVGNWVMLEDYPIEKDIAAILKADDILNRTYMQSSSRSVIALFVAYFKSQRAGQSPHSPKNCLPGNGWEPVEIGYVDVPAGNRNLHINRYVVAHGEDRSVVLYWYQNRDRVIASEYKAKALLVLDSVRYHRSDTSLIKFTVPFNRGTSIDQATAIGAEAIQSFFPALRAQLPM